MPRWPYGEGHRFEAIAFWFNASKSTVDFKKNTPTWLSVRFPLACVGPDEMKLKGRKLKFQN